MNVKTDYKTFYYINLKVIIFIVYNTSLRPKYLQVGTVSTDFCAILYLLMATFTCWIKAFMRCLPLIHPFMHTLIQWWQHTDIGLTTESNLGFSVDSRRWGSNSQPWDPEGDVFALPSGQQWLQNVTTSCKFAAHTLLQAFTGNVQQIAVVSPHASDVFPLNTVSYLTNQHKPEAAL